MTITHYPGMDLHDATTIAPGTPIGDVTPGTGAFTTLSSSGVTSLATTNADALTVGNGASTCKFTAYGDHVSGIGMANFVGNSTTGYMSLSSVSGGEAGFLLRPGNTLTGQIYADGNGVRVKNRLFGTADQITLNNSGRVGVGSIGSSATALLHLSAGVSAASGAPLKFTSGPLQTAPEAGAEEFLTNDRFYTGTDGVRRQYAAQAQTVSFTALTATTSILGSGNWGSQLSLGKTGQAGRVDFISGASGVSEAAIGFDSAGSGAFLAITATRVQFAIGGQEALNVRSLNGGSLSIGAVTPTARLHIIAGAAAAGRAPLKFNSGPLLTAPEPGAEEFLSNDRYYTGTDSVRRRYAVNGDVISLKSYTVATLPAGTVGDVAYVTDATAPTYNGVLTGGGAVVVPVFRNATGWVSA